MLQSVLLPHPGQPWSDGFMGQTPHYYHWNIGFWDKYGVFACITNTILDTLSINTGKISTLKCRPSNNFSWFSISSVLFEGTEHHPIIYRSRWCITVVVPVIICPHRTQSAATYSPAWIISLSLSCIASMHWVLLPGFVEQGRNQFPLFWNIQK